MLEPSLTLQIINGFFSILTLWAMAVFVRYIWTERRRGYDDLKPAIAITVLLFGEAFLRIPLWFARIQANLYGKATVIPTPSIYVGGISAIVALLCIIRVFSPERYGQKSWILALVVATIITLISLAITLRWI